MIKDESLKYQRSVVLQTLFEPQDNLTEILSYIINFTQARQKILINNINSADKTGFIPRDLPASEFAELLNTALDEHVKNERLLFCDTDHFTFKKNGSFDIKPKIDKVSAKILKKDKNQYIEMQVEKLLENTLNYKFAAETLKQKQIVEN